MFEQFEQSPRSSESLHKKDSPIVRGLTLTVAFLVSLIGGALPAQEKANEQATAEPTARLVTVTSPIGDEVLGQIRRTALQLQDTASREGRAGYLILEIQPGSSSFHNCYALADFLTENPLSNVTTVAYIPETVNGFNVLPALACQQIVMGPNASLGDIGYGKAVQADQQTIVRGIIERRRNPRVSVPLANALMDPQVSLVQLQIEPEEGQKETRLATSDEARKLQDEGNVILSTKTVIEPGTSGLLSSAQARNYDILALRTASSRRELIEGLGLSVDALKELTPAAPIKKVVYIELHDVIDEVFKSFAQRQIERAVSSGADLIVFEIDTPGGLLTVCADLSQQISDLSKRKVKTVAYIPREATSGGAILAVACDEIYMKSDAKIGDAIPINLMGKAIVHAEEKILSYELEILRRLAEAKNRPAAVLEAFADKDLEVFEATNKTTGRKWFLSQHELAAQAEEWIPGPLVPESRKGIAIMVNGARAHQLMISEEPIRDIDELKSRLGISPEMPFRSIGRTWVDSLVFTLNHPAMTGFIFFLAIICIYIELGTMTGFFGILSALAFAIFFWSKVMGGTADMLELALFVVGAACLLIEFFVIPGFGVFGVSGILLVLGSLIMASQTFTGFSFEQDLSRAGQTVGTLTASLILVAIAAAIISQNFHRIPILKEMVLVPPGSRDLDDGAPRLKPELAPEIAVLLGATGNAVTILRPSGKARIDGKLIDVVSDGPFVESGAAVTVVEVSKNRIVVREIT
ncbi:NfeD family protein [Planctomicrobium sp. SH668]|uniref:NfeD family protein n=1 Tax=Planctomicrobium sp. SH668 TaxID=3448126 RepID=UPI003F5C49C5